MRVTKPIDLVSSKTTKKKTIKQKINVTNSNTALKSNNTSNTRKYKKFTKDPPKESIFVEAQTKKHIENVTKIQRNYNPTTQNLNAPQISFQNKTQSRNNIEKNYASKFSSSNIQNNNNPEHNFNLYQNISVSTNNIFPSTEYIKNTEDKYQKSMRHESTMPYETKKYRTTKNSSLEQRHNNANNEQVEDFESSSMKNKISDFRKENNNDNLSYGTPNYFKQYQSYVVDRKFSGVDNNNENNFQYIDKNLDRNDLYSNRNRKATIELNQDNTLIFYEDKDKINDYENTRNSEKIDKSYNNYYSKMFPLKNKNLYSNYYLNKNRFSNKIPIGGFMYNNEIDSDYNNNINNSMYNQTSSGFFGQRIIPPNVNYQKNRRNNFFNNDFEANNTNLNRRMCNYSPKLGGVLYHSMIEQGDIQLSPMKNYINTNDNINKVLSKKNKIRILRSNKQIQEFDINLSDAGQDEDIITHNNLYKNNCFYSKDIIPMINNQFNINSNKNIIINNKKIRGNGGHSMQKRNNTQTIQNNNKNSITNRPLVQSSSVVNTNCEKQLPKFNSKINNSGIFEESITNKIFIKKIPKNEIPFPDKNKQSYVNLKVNHNINTNKNILTTISKETKDSKENISKDNTNEKHNFNLVSPCQCNSFNLLTETKEKTNKNEKTEKLLFNSENDVVEYVYKKFDEERKKKNYFNRKLRFTGFVLTKKLKGKNIFDIRIEEDLEKINKQLKEEGVTINNKQVELRYIGDKKNEKNNDKKNNENKINLKEKNSEECSKLKKENEVLIKKDEIKNELIKKLDKEKTNLIEEIKKLNKEIDVQKIINNKLMLAKKDSYIFEKSKLKENNGEKLEIIAEKKINTQLNSNITNKNENNNQNYYNDYKMNMNGNSQKENQKKQPKIQEPNLNFQDQRIQEMTHENQDFSQKINPEMQQQTENNNYIIEQNLIKNLENQENK